MTKPRRYSLTVNVWHATASSAKHDATMSVRYMRAEAEVVAPVHAAKAVKVGSNTYLVEVVFTAEDHEQARQVAHLALTGVVGAHDGKGLRLTAGTRERVAL